MILAKKKRGTRLMKKLVALAAVIALAAAMLAGCGIGGEKPKTYKVGVSIYKFDDNFMTLYREEIERYFESLESDTVKYDVTILDGKGDMVEQTENVEYFIANEVDVMIINLVQSSSANIITAMTKAANIPCVYINREPSEDHMKQWDKIVYVGADARQSGTYMGEIIRDLPDNGDADGDGVLRYAMIEGARECSGSIYRSDFAIKPLTDAGIAIETLFEKLGDWDSAKGRELAENALAEHGSLIDVVFAENDGMALGALQAIKAAGRNVGEDIYLVGADAIPEAIEAVKAGNMTGTVLNDHIGQARAAVNAVLVYLAGGTIDPQYVWVDNKKITG